MRSTIEMALEAGFQLADKRLYVYDRDGVCQEEVERLVELARADEREQGQKWFDAVTEQHKAEILAEREACAKVCENWTQTPETTGMELALCAAAIRARGETK
jgi:predicted kinase